MGKPVIFRQLTMRNFMSYGNNDTTLDLDFNEPTLIVGRNLDAVVNGQVDSNGAGKSAILDALSFALYDKTISNKEKANLINVVNKKNMEVSLTFEKDNKTYKIVRMRKSKTKADIRLFILDENGEWLDKTLDSIANNNAEIVRIIGIPYEIFSRIIVFSASFQPFLDLPSRHASKASQTSIMEELFGFTELSEKAELLKALIKETKADFTRIQELQEQALQEIDRHAAQVETAKQRVHDWDVDHKSDIEGRTNAVKKLEGIDFDAERDALAKLTEANDRLKERKSMLSNLRDKQKDRIQQRKNLDARVEALAESTEKVAMIEKAVDFDAEWNILVEIQSTQLESTHQYDVAESHEKEYEKAKKQFAKLENELGHLVDDKCPYCLQQFEGGEDKIKDINEELKDLTEQMNGLRQAQTSAKEKEAKLDAEVEELKKKSMFKGDSNEYDAVFENYEKHKRIVESHSDDEEDAITLDGAISELGDGIEGVMGEISEIEEDVLVLTATVKYDSVAELERDAARLDAAKEALEELKEATNPHKDVLKELEEIEFNTDRSAELNELEETLRHQEFLLKLLTKKDSFVRKSLLDRSLPYLNKRLMHYLDILGLKHRVEFLPDMTAQISQFGTALDFGSLSSGQRARVNLALAFAFRDVLQARYGKVSFCMLDECLDTGLGNVGVQLAAKMIKDIASEDEMSMFVISHRDEIANMFPKKLTVELKNGFSKIVND